MIRVLFLFVWDIKSKSINIIIVNNVSKDVMKILKQKNN